MMLTCHGKQIVVVHDNPRYQRLGGAPRHRCTLLNVSKLGATPESNCTWMAGALDDQAGVRKRCAGGLP